MKYEQGFHHYHQQLDSAIVPDYGAIAPLPSSFQLEGKNALCYIEDNFLSDAVVNLIGTRAGFGHVRVLLAVAHAYAESASYNHKHMLYESAASQIHRVGSTNHIAKWVSEYIQKSRFQHLAAWPIHSFVLQHDTLPVMNAIAAFSKQSSAKNHYHVAFHPDPAYILSQCGHIEFLNRKYNNKNFIITVLTDHLHLQPQFPVYLLNTDLLIVPDKGSKDMADDQLKIWARRMKSLGNKNIKIPDTVVSPFPIDHYLLQFLKEEQYVSRLEQVDPQKNIPMKILIPAGGSFPQKEIIERITRKLLTDPDNPHGSEIHLIARESCHTKEYLEHLKRLKIEVLTSSDDTKVIQLYNQFFNEIVPPSLVITKPSEIHVNTYIPPWLSGGAICLFTEPVGHQEFQNLDYLMQNGLVPSNQETMELTQILLNGNGFLPTTLREKSRQWRGLLLPKDSEQAASFIYNAKKLGLFFEMMQYIPSDDPKEELSLDGASKLWGVLYQFQEAQKIVDINHS